MGSLFVSPLQGSCRALSRGPLKGIYRVPVRRSLRGLQKGDYVVPGFLKDQRTGLRQSFRV